MSLVEESWAGTAEIRCAPRHVALRTVGGRKHESRDR